MKYQDLLKLTPQELTTQHEQAQELLRKLKLTHKINPLDNPMRIRHTRKHIARIQTAQQQAQ